MVDTGHVAQSRMMSGRSGSWSANTNAAAKANRSEQICMVRVRNRKIVGEYRTARMHVIPALPAGMLWNGVETGRARERSLGDSVRLAW